MRSRNPNPFPELRIPPSTARSTAYLISRLCVVLSLRSTLFTRAPSLKPGGGLCATSSCATSGSVQQQWCAYPVSRASASSSAVVSSSVPTVIRIPSRSCGVGKCRTRIPCVRSCS